LNNPDILSAIQPLIQFFEELGVKYYIGGSVASSAYGIARATLDVDIVSNLTEEQVPELVRVLSAKYYIDETMVRDAISTRSSFNIIHLETMLKVDIFILKKEPFHDKAFERRRKDTLDEDTSAIQFYLASPEDVLLNKLDWYRMGGCDSERQWNDIQGILKIQSNLLDMKYLFHWSEELDVFDLLNQALSEAGINA
jgi:hypothetical protein